MSAEAHESYLGLSESQVRAVVRIDDGRGTDAAACSGALLSPTRVITAKHCLQIATPRVSTPAAPAASWQVVDSIAHPDLDLALLKLESAMTETLAGPVQPFGLTSFEPQLLPGDPVEMAGYGLTESGTVGELRFLVEFSTRWTRICCASKDEK